MRSFRLILRGCLTTSFRWAHPVREVPREREKPSLETSFRTSFATARNGNGMLVDKQRLLPALPSGRNAAPKPAPTATPHLPSNPEVSGATSCPPNPPESSAQNPFKNPPQPHPGALQKQKISRHRRNDVSRQHNLTANRAETFSPVLLMALPWDMYGFSD